MSAKARSREPGRRRAPKSVIERHVKRRHGVAVLIQQHVIE
jgi:hypothetical protein